MLEFELFAGDRLPQHAPTGLGDLPARLCDDADFRVKQAQRFEIIHDEQRDILRDAQAEALDGWDDAFGGDVAGCKNRLGTVAVENLPGGFANLSRIKRKLVGGAEFEGAGRSHGVKKSFPSLIENPVFVGVAEECDTAVSGGEQVVAAKPARLTIVDSDGRKRILRLDPIKQNDRDAIGSSFGRTGWKSKEGTRMRPSIRRETRL